MWPIPQFPVDLVTFTEEIPNGRLYFLCSVGYFFSLLFFSQMYSPHLYRHDSHTLDSFCYTKKLLGQMQQ